MVSTMSYNYNCNSPGESIPGPTLLFGGAFLFLWRIMVYDGLRLGVLS